MGNKLFQNPFAVPDATCKRCGKPIGRERRNLTDGYICQTCWKDLGLDDLKDAAILSNASYSAVLRRAEEKQQAKDEKKAAAKKIADDSAMKDQLAAQQAEIESLKATVKANEQPEPETIQEKKEAKSEMLKAPEAPSKKASTKGPSPKQKRPINKKVLIAIVAAAAIAFIVFMVKDALKPDVESISAVYKGSTVENTLPGSEDFKVVAKYDDGTSATVTDGVDVESDTLSYGNTAKAKVTYKWKNKTVSDTVSIKCDKIITYKASDAATQVNLKRYAKAAVEQSLKAPSTAKFHDWDYGDYGKTGENQFLVVGKVDAENSFGATVTSTFMVVIELGQLDAHDFPTYSIESISID